MADKYKKKVTVHSGRDGSSSLSFNREIINTREGPNSGNIGIGKKVKVRTGAKSAKSYIIPKKLKDGAQAYIKKKK
jgi:GTPase involved in cell partitioning and DNA repair